MLTSDTKRHIDAARQVLVGVVPNPASQIDQITNALIYKFMDDMDQAAIKSSDEPSFFVDELEKFSWVKLMDPRKGNQERMNLYTEALQKFSESEKLPPLFREIFKSAFLPYRSPEVLDLFLKEIAYFDYSHSEELGNAYEYLLSIMSSQGDAGQFRTPRHIIDFIVAVVDPKKDDKVLDPACGTAGFLISAYKHVLAQHDAKNSDGSKNDEKPLTPDEKRTLLTNFEGYDIDPGMVRIAQVNMYLHQFKNPKIFSYNTLSDEDRWKDKFDVILANPPFMSPKGGVKTHNKFSIESSRSEVLFVDYIMNHLRPGGRAGVIIPEGIIFQSSSGHTQLRENLVEDGLWAVISLPSGVFSPYAGVKTSVLLFDNERAKKNFEIAFVKITNDGFDLGANKRPISKNDLPQAFAILREWKEHKKIESELVSYIEKSEISKSGDFNLTGDRYRKTSSSLVSVWPLVKLKDIEASGDITLGRGEVISKIDLENTPGDYPVYSSSAKGNGEFGRYGKYMFDEELITWSIDGGGRLFFRPAHKYSVTNVCGWLRNNNKKKIDTKFLYYTLNQAWQQKTFDYVAKAHPSVIREVYEIPLPPLEVQQEIVAEIDGYKQVITGAEQIFENWKPKIEVDPEWLRIELLDLFDMQNGRAFKKEEWSMIGLPIIRIANLNNENAEFNYFEGEYDKRIEINEGDLLFSWSGTVGTSFGPHMWEGPKGLLNQHIYKMNLKRNDQLLPEFAYWSLKQMVPAIEAKAHGAGGLVHITKSELNKFEISVPSIEAQQKIIGDIHSERQLIEGNRQLIKIYEMKSKKILEKLWLADKGSAKK